MKNNLDAVFTSFENNTNWCNGKIGPYGFEAKLYDEGSVFGINEGRVSKLTIWDDAKRREQGLSKACVVHYDRGWDIEPTEQYKPYLESVMALLENAPKRFE